MAATVGDHFSVALKLIHAAGKQVAIGTTGYCSMELAGLTDERPAVSSLCRLHVSGIHPRSQPLWADGRPSGSPSRFAGPGPGDAAGQGVEATSLFTCPLVT